VRFEWVRHVFLLAAIVGAGLLAEIFIVGSGQMPPVGHMPWWLIASAILSIPLGGIGYGLGRCKRDWVSYLGLLALIAVYVSIVVSLYLDVVHADEKGMFDGPDWLLFLQYAGGDMWFVPLPIALACFWIARSLSGRPR